MSRKWTSRVSTVLVSSLLAAGAIVASTSANAALILAFGQSVPGNTITGTTVGGNTTISADDASVFITFISGGAPTAAFLTLNASNTSAATVNGGEVDQDYSGTFCITSGLNCTGVNYLSGSFIDDYQAQLGGSGAQLGATTPPAANVIFTSDVIAAANLDLDRALAFGFTNYTPAVSICGTTICSFTAAVSGNFSANNNRQIVPEPGTLALLGLGLAGLGLARRRSAR